MTDEMSLAAEALPRRRPGGWRVGGLAPRVYTLLLIFLALVGVTAAALRPLQVSLRAAMVDARDAFIGRAEAALNRRLEYGSLGLSIFGTLDIRGVRALRRDGSVMASAGRIRLSYSFLALVRDGVGGALNAARVDRPALNLDADRDRDLLELFSGAGGAAAAGGAVRPGGTGMARLQDFFPIFSVFPDRPFRVHLRDGEVTARSAGLDLAVRSLTVSAGLSKDRVEFQGRFTTDLFARDPPGRDAGPAPRPLGVTASARLDGNLSIEVIEDMPGQFDGSAAVTLPGLRGTAGGSAFSLARPLRASVTIQDGRISVHKIYDGTPVDLAFDWDPRGGALSASLSADAFTPGDLVALEGGAAAWAPWLKARITGRASVERAGGQAGDGSTGLAYAVDLRGGLPGGAAVGPAAKPAGRPGAAGGVFTPAGLAALASDASFTLTGAGDLAGARVDAAEIRSRAGDLRFAGAIAYAPLAADGVVTARGLRLREGGADPADPAGTLSADLPFSLVDQQIRVTGGSLRAGSTALDGIDASASWTPGGIAFALSARRGGEAAGGDGGAGVAAGAAGVDSAAGGDGVGGVAANLQKTLRAEGVVDADPRRAQASLLLDSFPVSDALALARPFAALPRLPGAVAAITVTTEVFVDTDFAHVTYNAPRLELFSGGTRPWRLVVQAAGVDGRFDARDGRLDVGLGAGTGAGVASGAGASFGAAFGAAFGADFTNPDDVTFNAEFSHADLVYALSGSLLDRRSLSVNGSYGLRLFVGAGDEGGWSGYAQGDGVPFPFRGRTAQADFDVPLRYQSPGDWSAGPARIAVRDLDGPASPYTSFSLLAEADQDGAALRDIAWDDGLGRLSGEASLTWGGDLQARLEGAGETAAARETYAVHGLLRPPLAVALSGENMRLARLGGIAHGAVASGDITVEWESPRKFRAEAEIRGLFIRDVNGQDARLTGRVAVDEGAVTASNLTASWGRLEGRVDAAVVDRRGGRAAVHGAAVTGLLAGRDLDAALDGEIAFAPAESWAMIKGGLGEAAGSLTLTTARYGDLAAGEPFRFELTSGLVNGARQLALSGGPRNMVRASCVFDESGAGDFYAALSAPSPIRGAFTGRVDAEGIDARTGDLYVDLGALWALTPPQDVIAFPAGLVSAQLRVHGPLRDPEFTGSARGTSVRIQVPQYLTEDIRPAPMDITLDGDLMSFGPVDAAVGKGAGKVSAWFRFDRWVPGTFEIAIDVPQGRPIPIGFDIAGAAATGAAAGQLRLEMADRVFTVSGDLTAQDMELTLSEEAGEGGGDAGGGGGIAVVVDLGITAGRRVEFLWPSADFPVVQAYADMGTGLRVWSDTGARAFSLQGDVKLRGGEIYYLDRNFYIREGTLYLDENEASFDPRLAARAELRDQNEDGAVTISLIVDNAPLRSFEPRFESSPALSQLEIYALLGQAPDEGDLKWAQRTLITAATDALMQFAVVRRVQRGIRDTLGLDMFSVRTQILGNAVLQALGGSSTDAVAGTTGAGTTGSTVGAAADDGTAASRSTGVGNYFDNTTVFIGKYIGSDIFLQGLLTFRYDETETWGLALEPELSMDLRNPLFDLRLGIAPEHVEHWFIDDVSLTLTYRHSF